MMTAKIFRDGRSQAVRLHKECRFDTDEVRVARLGDAVVLYPPGKGWDILDSAIAKFTDDFMVDRDQPKRHDKRQPSGGCPA